MTEEERTLLDQKIKLSGRLKQDYITESVLNHKVVFVGDRNVFNVFEKKLIRIEKTLKQIHEYTDIDRNDMYLLETIIELLDF